MTLLRPEESNRIDNFMAEEINLVCQNIREDDSLALAVFTGSGECFSVGREGPGQAF